MSHPSPQVSPVVPPAQPAHPSQTASAVPATAPTVHNAQTTTPSATAHGTQNTLAATTPANPTIAHAWTASTLAPAPEAQTFYDKLNASDREWQWKIGMRLLLVIISIIGIGSAAWVVANFSSRDLYGGYEYDSDDNVLFPWVLITFILSLIWSSICIAIFMRSKTHSPVHPGAQVGLDLVLWIGYIATGSFAVVSVLMVRDYGSSGIIGGSYSNMGPWTYVQGNNTWVYNSTSSSSSYYTSSSNVRSCMFAPRVSGRPFKDCEELDGYINHLWSTKNARFNAELCATACQCIGFIFHFVLFVWACVDTNRRNKTNVSKSAEKQAATIIQNMIKCGAIIPAPGPGQTHPMAPGIVPQQTIQGYPQYTQYPQYHQHPAFSQQPQPEAPSQPPRPQQTQHFSRPLSSPGSPQPGTQPPIPSGSNEKSMGSRFA